MLCMSLSIQYIKYKGFGKLSTVFLSKKTMKPTCRTKMDLWRNCVDEKKIILEFYSGSVNFHHIYFHKKFVFN